MSEGDVKCQNCLDHKEVLKSIKLLEDGQKEHDKRIGKLEVNEGKRDEKIDNILEVVKELKIKVETVLQLPGQRWNTVQTVLITSIINGVIGLIILKLTGKL